MGQKLLRYFVLWVNNDPFPQSKGWEGMYSLIFLSFQNQAEYSLMLKGLILKSL